MQAMPSPILYVTDVPSSAAYYAKLLGRPAAEQSPGFAMFTFPSGGMLGLWRRADVLPAATQAAGGSELAWALPDRAAVDVLHQQWRQLGAEVIQPPTAMDFGYTFTVQDPDGNRLRVFHPERN